MAMRICVTESPTDHTFLLSPQWTVGSFFSSFLCPPFYLWSPVYYSWNFSFIPVQSSSLPLEMKENPMVSLGFQDAPGLGQTELPNFISF